jgi:hypothetical protein
MAVKKNLMLDKTKLTTVKRYYYANLGKSNQEIAALPPAINHKVLKYRK